MRHFLVFLLDVAVWLLFPAVFLFVYVRFTLAESAIWPHIRLVAVLLLCLMLLRVVLALLVRRATAQRLGTTITVSVAFAAMFLYYGLVVIGLNSWGRVISWNLLTVYASQAPQLAEVLGLSLSVVGGALLLVFLGILCVVWLYLKKFDWVPHFVARTRAPVVAAALILGSAIVAIESYSYFCFPPARQGEPISLTIFPLSGAWDLQGLAIDNLRSAKLDQAENAARVAYHPNQHAHRRNLILIVIDALRPDHLGVYGYARDTTPALGRFDKAGQLRRAMPLHATCASSACGLFSLGSSKFAHQFSSHPFTLQEVLKLHGYRIHMLLSGDHTNFYNLRKIYGPVESFFDGQMVRAFKYVNDDQLVLDHLAEFPRWDGVPAMFQFHLMSAHLLGKRQDYSVRFVPAGNYALAENRSPGPDGRPDRAINYYDNGVFQSDTVIHSLLQTLGRKGYLSDALVLVTGDHGESLGEHGLYQHANSVHEELLRIPLVLVSFGYKPETSIDRTDHGLQVDIAPTILEEFGMPIPQTWEGTPLQRPAARDFSYFREQNEIGLFDYRDSRKVWKYWFDLGTSREYAFDLKVDPGENANSITTIPASLSQEWRSMILPTTLVEVVPRSTPSGVPGGTGTALSAPQPAATPN